MGDALGNTPSISRNKEDVNSVYKQCDVLRIYLLKGYVDLNPLF